MSYFSKNDLLDRISSQISGTRRIAGYSAGYLTSNSELDDIPEIHWDWDVGLGGKGRISGKCPDSAGYIWHIRYRAHPYLLYFRSTKRIARIQKEQDKYSKIRRYLLYKTVPDVENQKERSNFLKQAKRYRLDGKFV